MPRVLPNRAVEPRVGNPGAGNRAKREQKVPDGRDRSLREPTGRPFPNWPHTSISFPNPSSYAGCGDALRRVSYESYEMTYCPNCQTSGKILDQFDIAHQLFQRWQGRLPSQPQQTNEAT